MQKSVSARRIEQIRIKKKNLKTLVRELATVKEKFFCTLSFLDFNHVFNLIVSSNEKSIFERRHVQQKKLRNLIPDRKPETSLDSHDAEKGLRFALSPEKIDYADFLGTV